MGLEVRMVTGNRPQESFWSAGPVLFFFWMWSVNVLRL